MRFRWTFLLVVFLTAAAAKSADLSQTYVLIADRTSSKIVRYTLDGQFVDIFAQDPPLDNHLFGPDAMAFGPDQNLFVTSPLASGLFVRRNGANGSYTAGFIRPSQLRSPESIVFTPDGTLLVSDFTFGAVAKIDPNDGTFLGYLIAPGGVLTSPAGIALGPDGNLYVTNGNPSSLAGCAGAPPNPKVMKFDSQSGAYLGDFVVKGSSSLSAPTSLVFAPDGSLFVSSTCSHEVFHYEKNGSLIGRVAGPDSGLQNPHGLAIGPDSNLYVVSSTGASMGVLRYSQNGTFQGQFITGPPNLQGPTAIRFYSFESQIAPEGKSTSIATDSLGNRYMVWDDNGNVYGQLFGADGTARGGATRLTPAPIAPASGSRPRVTARNGGGFMVAAQQEGNGTPAGVFLWTVPPGNTPTIPPPVPVVPPDPVAGGKHPSLTAAVDGTDGAVVVFERPDPSGGTEIIARKVAANAAPIGGEVIVAAGNGKNNDSPAIASDSAKRVFVAWRSGTSGPNQLLARTLDTSLNAEEPAMVVDDGTKGAIESLSVGGNRSGRWVMAWNRVATSSGGKLGSLAPDNAVVAETFTGTSADSVPVRLNLDAGKTPHDVSVAVGSGGDSAVVWRYDDVSTGISGVYGRALSASAVPERTEFVVSDGKAANERYAAPSVTLDAGSRPTIAEEKTSSGAAAGVIARSRNLDAAIGCTPSATVTCLFGNRFSVSVRYRNHNATPFYDADALVKKVSNFSSPGSYETALFYFNDPNNIEVTVKLLSQADGKVQVYFGASTDLQLWVTVRDWLKGISREYHKAVISLCGEVDRETFPASVAPQPQLAEWRAPEVATCSANATTACFENGRFTATVRYRNHFANPPVDAIANVKPGGFVGGGYETGFFYFNDPNNVEVTLKLLAQGDGKVQVYYGATTDLELWLDVSDAKTGIVKEYHKDPFTLCGEVDRATFPC